MGKYTYNYRGIKEERVRGNSGMRECNGGKIMRSYSEYNYAAAYKGILVRISPISSMTSLAQMSVFASITNCKYLGSRPSAANGGKNSPYALHNLMWVKGDRYTEDKVIAARVKRAVNRFLKKQTSAAMDDNNETPKAA